jgi:hypothetical protein
MRFTSIIVIGAALGTSTPMFAQSVSGKPNDNEPPANAISNALPSANKSSPQSQPQGDTGPINTTSGGAGASSPQGDTPAGMQPTPQNPYKPDAGK